MLFREISIFVDMKGFIFNTDYYVIRFLLDYHKAYGTMYAGLNYLEDYLFMFYGNMPPDEVIVALCATEHINPLYDMVDHLSKPEDFHYGLLDDIYNEILYTVEYLPEKYLLFSDISNTFNTIIDMDECREICIYTERDIPSYIELLIIKKFNSDKVKIITGAIEKALYNEKFDSYFIRDISKIQYIPRIYHQQKKNKERIDIVVPLNRFNITIENNKEILDSFIPPDKLISEYNIDLRASQLPL